MKRFLSCWKKILRKKNLDTILLIRIKEHHILTNQIYVDIFFNASDENICNEFYLFMKNKFEISMMRELNFFLELKIKILSNKFFLSQKNL